MKKQLFSLTFLAFSFFLIVSCRRESKETASFQNYLTTTFHKEIGQGQRYFLLVPGTQCKGCTFFDADKLSEDINQRLTVITTFPPHNFKGFRHLLEDTTGTLETLPLVNYSNKLVVTEDGQIKSVNLVYNLYRQLDSLNKF